MRKKITWMAFAAVLSAGLLSGCLVDDDTDYEAREKKERDKYLEDNNITVEPTESGLYIIMLEEGLGENAALGDTVTIEYEGYFLDGRIFDTNIESVAVEYEVYSELITYEPFTFILGVNQMFEGIEEGLTHMNEGGSAQLVIPSELFAPGSYQTMVYYIYLLDVGKAPN
jgi:FKBP-type peptidyl-prolyl cis-trans isomerase